MNREKGGKAYCARKRIRNKEQTQKVKIEYAIFNWIGKHILS